MNINNLIVMQTMMFIIIGIGAAAFKRGIITTAGKKSMIDLVIHIVLPCNILSSFHVDVNLKILISSMTVLIMAFTVQIFSTVLSKLLYRKTPHGQRMVLQYATICSNATYLGNPIVESIYGLQGQLYASIYLIPLRIFMWSVGLSCFTEAKGRDVMKKLIVHPCIIATFAGFLWMVSGISLPQFAVKTFDTVGSCTTALSMFIIGVILAESSGKGIVSRLSLFYCFIRLLFIPGVVLAVGLLLHIDAFLLGVTVVLAGMPAGMATAILASKYNGDEAYASKCVFLSTLLSMVTVPMFCLLLQYFTV